MRGLDRVSYSRKEAWGTVGCGTEAAFCFVDAVTVAAAPPFSPEAGDRDGRGVAT